VEALDDLRRGRGMPAAGRPVRLRLTRGLVGPPPGRSDFAGPRGGRDPGPGCCFTRVLMTGGRFRRIDGPGRRRNRDDQSSRGGALRRRTPRGMGRAGMTTHDLLERIGDVVQHRGSPSGMVREMPGAPPFLAPALVDHSGRLTRLFTAGSDHARLSRRSRTIEGVQ
jgi:hypothetical protein